jgi:hypothetical protein
MDVLAAAGLLQMGLWKIFSLSAAFCVVFRPTPRTRAAPASFADVPAAGNLPEASRGAGRAAAAGFLRSVAPLVCLFRSGADPWLFASKFLARLPSKTWGSAGSLGAAIEDTSTSAAWPWESPVSRVATIFVKLAAFNKAGPLDVNGATSTSVAWGSSASSGGADAKLMPNVELTKAGGLSAGSVAVDEETSSSAACEILAAGDILAAGEAGGAARRAKLAPSASIGFGEARSSANAVLPGDGAPGEARSSANAELPGDGAPGDSHSFADAVLAGNGAPGEAHSSANAVLSSEGDVNMAMWTPRAQTNGAEVVLSHKTLSCQEMMKG